MKKSNSVIAFTYHLFFAMCGIGGIAIVFYRLWDLNTAASPDDNGMFPTIAAAVLMVGFSGYGILFRKRVYPKYFGQDIGSISAFENLTFGVAWTLVGLAISMWTDYLAYGAILWGILQATHGVIQFVLPAARRNQGRSE